jgi:hypothetical protein
MNLLYKAVHSRERGAALIIALAFVVLLTGVAIAYLSRATSDRQVAHSSFNQSNVDQLAQSAMESIIGNLRQEIANGSDARTVASSTVYVPKNTAGPPVRTASDNMLPVRSAPATIPNLIRISVRSDGIPFPAGSSQASAVNSTSDASANGRSVSLPRWNKHYLVPRPAGTDPSVTTPIADFGAPDWVFVSNTSAVTITAPNPAVIGRYAYAIYDEGGLVDVNVAGYPNNTTTAQYGRKGVSAFADLTVLGLSSPGTIDSIVGWRNLASAQPGGTFPGFTFTAAQATNYVSSVLSNTNGFMTVRATRADGTDNVWVSGSGGGNAAKRTDQMFPDRQTLIKFRASSGFNANALQYLGTFSRELNAPSWQPLTPTGSSIDYANLASIPTPETSTAINRQLLSVRVVDPGGWTRFDGSTAIAGEPLVERRFPLSRLAWITYKGPSGDVYAANNSDPAIVQLLASNVSLETIQLGTAANIQSSFGLVWVPPDPSNPTDPTRNRWNYVGASGSTIQTVIERLDQVARENREPNFFELLKAAILAGSVGVGSGPGSTFVAAQGRYYYDPSNPNISADAQIVQIGANLIDQADPDKNPTFVAFGATPTEFAGVENLPYLNKIGFQSRWTGLTAFTAFLVPSFWNPAQNAAAAGSASASVPTVRFVMKAGSARAVVEGGVSSATSDPVIVTNTASQPWVNLTPTTNFGPAPDAAASSTSVKNVMFATPNSKLGIQFNFSALGTVTRANATRAYPKISSATFEMDAQIGGTSGPWKPFQVWLGSTVNMTGVTSAFTPPLGFDWTQTTIWDPEFVLLDPRTMRFGVWASSGNLTGNATDFTRGWNETLDRSPGGFQLITGMPPQGSWFTGAGAEMGENTGTGASYYLDQDMRRHGDYLTSGATSAILPTDSNDRLLILDRPFQSIAELGQVFRDQPWKTLNLTTPADSADAGLMDVFTLHESSMEAGKSSLNTKQPLVLKAILGQGTSGGVLKRLAGTSADLITQSQRDNIVTALTNLTTAQPMVNKTELVTRVATDPAVAGLGNKEARECVLRAFSDACQTRTWNLLIDVIAQSGRYPPNLTQNPSPADLPKFVVDGEQRYWVHIAIDRFTGQVIDKQIEVVTE